MPAQMARITLFSNRDGSTDTVTIPVNKVRAFRQKCAERGVILTSSKIVKA